MSICPAQRTLALGRPFTLRDETRARKAVISLNGVTIDISGEEYNKACDERTNGKYSLASELASILVLNTQ